MPECTSRRRRLLRPRPSPGSAVTPPVTLLAQANPEAVRHTVPELLSALVADSYDEARFRCVLDSLVASAPEDAWELLSALDQHYRRGRIKVADYRAVNSYLLGLLFRSMRSPGPDVPPAPVRSRAFRIEETVPIEPVEPIELLVPIEPIQPIQPIEPIVPITPIESSTAVACEDRSVDFPFVGGLLRDRYRIVGILGRGGCGTVFEAVDQYRIGMDADRRVAVKVLHAAVSGRPELLSALVREFQHAQSLSHPNIVRVYDFDRDGQTAYLTMELLRGFSLDRLLSARDGAALDRPFARALIGDIGAALAHAHSRGVVHGDINPHNIFVTDTGAVRVLDFGSSSREGAVDAKAEADTDAPGRTRFATLRYASCELLEGGIADLCADVYAFACVAYVLLTGKHPFANRTAIQARLAGVIPPRPAGLARGQWQTLREGLHLEGDCRPADVAQWVRRLNAGAATRSLPPLSTLIAAQPAERRSAFRPAAGAMALLLLTLGLSLPANQRPITPTAAKLPVIVRPGPPRPPVRSLAAKPLPARIPRRVPAAVAGPARIELAANMVRVASNEPFARVVVRRSGGSRGVVSFRWRTAPGTARRGADFNAAAARTAYIAAGRRTKSLFIPIVTDPGRRQPATFYVIIDSASPGATIGRRTIAMITIPAARRRASLDAKARFAVEQTR